MSWDVFIQHLPASAVSVEDVPDDFAPLPLGSRAYVLNVIASVFPAADASDPTWLTLETPAYSIDFGLGAEDPVPSVVLHVRGDESVIPPIASLIEKFGARALDSWTGEFFEPSSAADSIRRWSAYVRESSP
jgi:hypothetical protein